MRKSILLTTLLSILMTSSISAQTQKTDPQKNASTKISIRIDKDITIKLDLMDWNYALQKKDMPSFAQTLANQLESGGSMLPLFGLSPDGLIGIRIIAEPTNMKNSDYFDLIKFVNRTGIDEATEGAKKNFGNTNGILWNYAAKGQNFRFFEYITGIGKYNFRLTIWTTKMLFRQKISLFTKIVNSIEVYDSRITVSENILTH